MKRSKEEKELTSLSTHTYTRAGADVASKPGDDARPSTVRTEK